MLPLQPCMLLHASGWLWRQAPRCSAVLTQSHLVSTGRTRLAQRNDKRVTGSVWCRPVKIGCRPQPPFQVPPSPPPRVRAAAAAPCAQAQQHAQFATQERQQQHEQHRQRQHSWSSREQAGTSSGLGHGHWRKHLRIMPAAKAIRPPLPDLLPSDLQAWFASSGLKVHANELR